VKRSRENGRVRVDGDCTGDDTEGRLRRPITVSLAETSLLACLKLACDQQRPPLPKARQRLDTWKAAFHQSCSQHVSALGGLGADTTVFTSGLAMDPPSIQVAAQIESMLRAHSERTELQLSRLSADLSLVADSVRALREEVSPQRPRHSECRSFDAFEGWDSRCRTHAHPFKDECQLGTLVR